MKRKEKVKLQEAFPDDEYDVSVETESRSGNKRPRLQMKVKTRKLKRSNKRRETGRNTTFLNELVIDEYPTSDGNNQPVTVVNFKATIDNEAPTITEQPDYLEFESPTLRVSAEVQVAPMRSQQTWEIGFVQACASYKHFQTFGHKGQQIWDLPELSSGKQAVVNDSSGDNYPWYNSDSSCVTFTGPCRTNQTAVLSMEDTPIARTGWWPELDKRMVPNITNSFRDQSFIIWLVAFCNTSNESYVLKTVFWDMQIEIDVDPKKRLGHRARLLSDPTPKQPVEVRGVCVPFCALLPPCANFTQSLVWCPRRGKSSRIQT